MLDDSPSRPISSSEPGCVTTKLCGMMSLFSNTISTGLPACGGDPILVEEHLIGDRAQPDHPNSQIAQLAADPHRLVGRQQARERVAKLDGVEAVGRSPVLRRNRLDVRQQTLERGPASVGRPVGNRDPRDRLDRRGPIAPPPRDEFRQGLEGSASLPRTDVSAAIAKRA